MHRFARNGIFMISLVAVMLTMNIGGMLSSGTMTEDGVMHDCPYMGVTALCDMSPLEHLSQWRMMFSATLQQFSNSLLLLLLAFILAWHVTANPYAPPTRTKGSSSRHRHTTRDVFDPLRSAFARGIIHPKVF